MLGFGIALGVIVDVTLDVPKGFIKALSLTMKKEFGTIKVACDICWHPFCCAVSRAF